MSGGSDLLYQYILFLIYDTPPPNGAPVMYCCVDGVTCSLSIVANFNVSYKSLYFMSSMFYVNTIGGLLVVPEYFKGGLYFSCSDSPDDDTKSSLVALYYICCYFIMDIFYLGLVISQVDGIHRSG